MDCLPTAIAPELTRHTSMPWFLISHNSLTKRSSFKRFNFPVSLQLHASYSLMFHATVYPFFRLLIIYGIFTIWMPVIIFINMHTFYTLSYLSKKIICKFYLPCAMLVLYDFKRTGVYMMKTKKTIFSYKLTCSLLAFFLFFCSFSFVGCGRSKEPVSKSDFYFNTVPLHYMEKKMLLILMTASSLLPIMRTFSAIPSQTAISVK